MKINSKLTYIIILFLSIIFIIVGYNICKVNIVQDSGLPTYKAKVLSIDKLEENKQAIGDQTITSKTIYFTSLLTNSNRQGQTVSSIQNISGLSTFNVKEIKSGDNIILTTQDSQNDDVLYTFLTYNRENGLLLLLLVFLILVLVLGKKKGIRTIISLAITFSALLLCLVPSILKGYNIYLSTFIISIFIIISSLCMINGINIKTLCAIIGNVLGVACSAVLCLFMNYILKISGFISEDYTSLQLFNSTNPINLTAVIWCGIVIGSLGAIMDTAMTISSSMNELSFHMEGKSFKKLFQSGMNIGKDLISTMTNTLILAYIGSSLSFILMLVAVNVDYTYLFNTESIAVEILQSLIGSIGIIISIPITVSVCAYFSITKKPN